MSYGDSNIGQKGTDNHVELSLSEKILSSKWFGIAMVVAFVAGLILASITASPTVTHAIGTTIPGATGGSLMAVSLLGLFIHWRTNAIIERRANPSLFDDFVKAIESDPNYHPNAPELTPEEWRAKLAEEARRQRDALSCLNDP